MNKELSNNRQSETSISDLTALLSCANIPINEALKNFEMIANKKILEQHKFKVYFSESECAWRTYLPDDTKPRKRKPLKRATKENLENEIIKFYKEQQKLREKNGTSLTAIYERWLIYRRDFTPAKAKTITENIMEWNKFLKDTELSRMSIKDIRAITLIRFFRALTKDRLYTRKRISNVRSVLNGIFSYAVEEELIEHNPVGDVNFKSFTYKPVENQIDNVFSKDDAIKLLTYLGTIKDEPYALAISLSFYLFIRVGETKALRWEDIDYDKRTIYLHGQVLTERQLNDDLTLAPRQTILSDQMKGNTSKGFRKQYLTDDALEILTKARRLNPFGKFIFEPQGKPMTSDRFNRRLKQYCDECNIPYHSSHKIRFYNASTAYDGKNLTTVSKLMGHSEVATTLHYLRNVDRGENDELAFQNLGFGVQRCSKKIM